jgi:hypothetical protein
MEKRGQVTVFIVLGIVMLAGMSVFLFLSGGNKEIITDKLETDSLKSYIQNCLEKSSTKAITDVLAQGGYFKLPEKVLSYDEFDQQLRTAYYFFDGELLAPGLDDIADNVALAGEAYFTTCIDDFKAFDKEGLVMDRDAPRMQVEFLEETTNIKLDFPVRISRKSNEIVDTSRITESVVGSEVELSRFSINLPFKFKESYENLQEFFNKQENEKDFLVSELSEVPKESLLNFNQFGEAGNEVLVDLTFEEPIVFSFGMHFPWDVESEENEQVGGDDEVSGEDVEVLILTEVNWNITREGKHTKQLEFRGDDLKFSINDDRIKVSDAGLLSLDAKDFPNDEYWFFVKAQDDTGEVIAPLFLNVNVGFPKIEFIPSQIARVGQEFRLQMTVNGEGPFVYNVESDLFPIDASGLIRFIPDRDDLGVQQVRVDVSNEKGSTWQRWELDVK